MANQAPAPVNADLPVAAALAELNPDAGLFCDEYGETSVRQAIRFVEQLDGTLRKVGLPESARVCVVLPNGTFMALTAIGLMATASFAPLNPRLTVDEYRASFEDLAADALISTVGFSPAAHSAAKQLGLCILDADATGRLIETTHRVGSPALMGIDSGLSAGTHALLLHTSGTTARPKLIGLSGDNLITSARAIAATLSLGPDDRCLSVMPLFHIHGLVGVILASLVCGANVRTTDRFDPLIFPRQLVEPGITWTSAVPSMYMAMLLRSGAALKAPGLRFVRSSSAPLVPSIAAELESALDCPVINSYGMTEASHQMTSNPIPPGERRPGTVGRSAGAEIAVLNHGVIASTAGVSGEVVVRGPGLMDGYLAPLGANETAWHESWFRTGDVGSMDADGYLTLHGRIKEIINVAGEKVSPYEVEAVLLGHPQVAEVVAFASPDRLRGERVCVAIVARSGSDELTPAAMPRVRERTPCRVQGAARDRGDRDDSGRSNRKGAAISLGSSARPGQPKLNGWNSTRGSYDTRGCSGIRLVTSRPIRIVRGGESSVIGAAPLDVLAFRRFNSAVENASAVLA